VWEAVIVCLGWWFGSTTASGGGEKTSGDHDSPVRE
jgi:hypothetical protein